MSGKAGDNWYHTIPVVSENLNHRNSFFESGEALPNPGRPSTAIGGLMNREIPGTNPADLLQPEQPPRCTSIKEALQLKRELRRRKQLAAAWEFMRRQARTEEEKAELDQELERQLAEGPRYHRGSRFTDAPHVNTDRNFLSRVLFLARALESRSYKERAKGAHGGVLGRSALNVLELLINFAKKRGKVAPGYVALAVMARVCRDTVMTAIAALERWGFVTVVRRLKKVRTALGAKIVQDTCAFDLHPPGLAGGPRPYGRVAGGLLAAMMPARSESKNSAVLKNPSFKSSDRTQAAVPGYHPKELGEGRRLSALDRYLPKPSSTSAKIEVSAELAAILKR
jgi:hypothetical protein